MPHKKLIVLLAPLLLLGACGSDAENPNAAQTVYHNGNIITVDDNDRVVQSIAIRDGKIVDVGSDTDMQSYIGKGTAVIDLAGKTMIPGIYDAHSHFTMAGTNELYDANLNSAPIGDIESMSDLLDRLREQRSKIDGSDWISGWGYDDTLLAEQRHPTRADLDQISATQPILITHVSGHFAVANSAALALANVTRDTPDPVGGTIRRDAQGEPTGVLDETAVQLVSAHKPAFTAAQVQAGIAAAARQYASQGVTTASEGATYAPAIAALETAAQSGTLPIRVIALPAYDYRIGSDKVELTSGKVKLGGIKDFSDGSIQGYTGYLSHPYHTPFHGDANYSGTTRNDRTSLAQHALKIHQEGKQMLVHGNGDQAIDDILFAFGSAQAATPREDSRHTVIHSQMGTESQLDEMKAQGVIPSFFVLHTYYWGDRHRDIFLGNERASRISPTRSALQRGLKFTIHTDTPIVPMEPMKLIWSAVNRLTTSGQVLGADQTISPLDALRATTINAAYQNFEEKERGSIEKGKFADLAILSADPLSVDKRAIKDIEVLETIVEGKSVFKR
ncbi:amidohydrolase [Oryzisolibacter sp. LB2S]|uniref:amidohydrolase n=1 Tax=Alicycliphilus soli TaxID=3228789 RepID=UPI0034586D90